VDRPAAPTRPTPAPVGVSAGDEGSAALVPNETPFDRPRRRLDIDQLATAMKQVSGGIGWTERRGNRDVDLFEELSSTLGKPDYVQNTEEDLEPTILFQKFLDDASRSVCARLLEADLDALAEEAGIAAGEIDPTAEGFVPPRERVLLRHVDPNKTIAEDPAAVDANLRWLLLRFHGKAIAPDDDVSLANWRWLVKSGAHVTEPATAWLGVCVALFTHPDFYSY
ncbi:MAG: hypothetical protein KC620_16330, partial [Myxococcales bacterium]|nr:hypothetical protein [Myxococcales bacterium]